MWQELTMHSVMDMCIIVMNHHNLVTAMPLIDAIHIDICHEVYMCCWGSRGGCP